MLDHGNIKLRVFEGYLKINDNYKKEVIKLQVFGVNRAKNNRLRLQHMKLERYIRRNFPTVNGLKC